MNTTAAWIANYVFQKKWSTHALTEIPSSCNKVYDFCWLFCDHIWFTQFLLFALLSSTSRILNDKVHNNVIKGTSVIIVIFFNSPDQISSIIKKWLWVSGGRGFNLFIHLKWRYFWTVLEITTLFSRSGHAFFSKTGPQIRKWGHFWNAFFNV